jgi:hypothetical protein
MIRIDAVLAFSNVGAAASIEPAEVGLVFFALSAY